MDKTILLPQPRRLEIHNDKFEFLNNKKIYLNAVDDENLLRSIQNFNTFLTKLLGIDWIVTYQPSTNNEISIDILIDRNLVGRAQGYRLIISTQRITIIGNDPAGANYGLCTLMQILKNPELTSRNQVSNLEIYDWPDFTARGVMLDISRDKVPTMETMYRIVDMLASLKINQFQLYTEHTFAYQHHPEVWANASPFTAEEIRVLDQYCQDKFIELVPNQNSFGHMHRWLQHPRYAPLGELYGVQTDQWWGHGSFSLSPINPKSFELIQSLYEELLPNFSSRQINIGCDETFDLGLGQSKQAVEEQGKGHVYLDFILKLYEDVKTRDHTVQFWGDIVLQHPELVGKLPKDLIALEWGYEADHPFDTRSLKFAEAGIPFYVCPGTSSWNSIAGRTENAILNLSNAAAVGYANDAIGFLITDWGDNGHWQTLPVSYLGFAFGASISWNRSIVDQSYLTRALDNYIFQDLTGKLGLAAYNLGNVYTHIKTQLQNASPLFKIMQTPIPKLNEFRNGLTDNTLDLVDSALYDVEELISKANPATDDRDLIKSEFELTKEILSHASKRGRYLIHPSEGSKNSLLHEIDSIIHEYGEIWHRRNRHGGFQDSVNRFNIARNDYLG